jgi:chromosome segregation ATPase
LESGQKAIENSIGEIKREIQVLEIGQTEIKGEIRTLDAKITGLNERVQLIEASVGKIPDLAEKIGEVKNWKQIRYIDCDCFSGWGNWLVNSGKIKLGNVT